MGRSLREVWDGLPKRMGRPVMGNTAETRWFVKLASGDGVQVEPLSKVPLTVTIDGTKQPLPSFPGDIVFERDRPETVTANAGESRLTFVSMSGNGRDPSYHYTAKSVDLEAGIDLHFGRVCRDESTDWVEENYAYVELAGSAIDDAEAMLDFLVFVGSALQALPLAMMRRTVQTVPSDGPLKTRQFMSVDMIMKSAGRQGR